MAKIPKWDDPPGDGDAYPEPPGPQNCRCVLLYVDDVPWIIEVQWIMDLIFGDTKPRLPEYR